MPRSRPPSGPRRWCSSAPKRSSSRQGHNVRSEGQEEPLRSGKQHSCRDAVLLLSPADCHQAGKRHQERTADRVSAHRETTLSLWSQAAAGAEHQQSLRAQGDDALSLQSQAAIGLKPWKSLRSLGDNDVPLESSGSRSGAPEEPLRLTQ
ncbi:hypothetical protein NDU88_001267 [Pleurodeles waltl]|uniref:Uncharacterized protein n=1 Tax=Pleurodeles waltl TaxID=8319 RepID=A0AAV7TJL5_PLEWA|nr:hypothetical protein NDU88_001267 [Pleurodeles waltl]